MQLYEVDTGGSRPTWHGTRDVAHAQARGWPNRNEVRVYLWDVQVTKEDVLSILAGKAPRRELQAAWLLTARGGLASYPLDKAKSEMDCFNASPAEEQGPFYWYHPESESHGKVETRAELDAMLESELVVQIDRKRFDDLEAIDDL